MAWQHPFVNIFKKFSQHIGTEGDAVQILDPVISKQCYKVQGSISANNYLQIPGVSAAIITGNHATISGEFWVSAFKFLIFFSIIFFLLIFFFLNFFYLLFFLGNAHNANLNKGAKKYDKISVNNSITVNSNNTNINARRGLGGQIGGGVKPHFSLGLTGEFLYLQIRTIREKFFNVHLDFGVADRNRGNLDLVERITLSNMHAEPKAQS